MPRDLGDVIHHFIPEAGKGSATAPSAASTAHGSGRPATSPAHVVGLPIIEGDVLRAAFAWNLSVELARAGAASHLIAPRDDAASAAWPAAGEGPLGAILELSDTSDGQHLSQLAARADDAARAPVAGRPKRRARCTLACIPEVEIEAACESNHAPQRWLLLCSASTDSLTHTRDLILRIGRANPAVQIGATIHGVRSIDEARDAFDALAVATDASLAKPIDSYGLVADDLHLYRAIVAGRPIGLAHPQSPAARALADAAKLLLEDLGEPGHV
ncbi:MAG: hypothetical protein VX246_00215 [Myxococcota bacterium]|nr:hypothetical protein [Myxococcota bacterium]